MKVLYSQIKEMVPDLKAGPQEIGEALTLTGFMMDEFEEVSYNGKKDYLLGLEVRQNRPDCFSVMGLAREVAAYYGLSFKAPSVVDLSFQGKEKLNIDINATDYVKRVLAVKLEKIKNQKSPDWLREYVKFYDLNSINLLVDLSNYVMFLTGYPSHLIDLDKTTGNIAWSLNKNFKEITTLFGEEINLNQNTELIINDDENILGLAGLVGGRAAQIDLQSKTIIAELAVYDHAVIRNNSRDLNITTEASHRLSKGLNPNYAEYAIKLLTSLIREHAEAEVTADLFDYYPKKTKFKPISLDTNLPSKFAGIEIPEKKVLKILKNLNFDVKSAKGAGVSVTPPDYRTDVSLVEDVIEEVVRIFGYDKIPTDQAPQLAVTPDITPKEIIVSEKIRETLSALAYDEILSWPMVGEGDNSKANYKSWNEITTQNSVNDLHPNLRQSILTGLLNQLEEYDKKNVDLVNIFEIGKIFGEQKGKYTEYDSLGVMEVAERDMLPSFKDKVEALLRLLGLKSISYIESAQKPQAANPNSCWDINIEDKAVGIIYKLRPQEVERNTYFAEVSIPQITKILLKSKNNPVVEITRKLVVLDANVILEKDKSVFKYIEDLKKKLKEKNLWSLSVVDAYPADDKIKYTFRATYKEVSDQEAKQIHTRVFNL